MIWNYLVLSSIHYIDDIPAILLFILGMIALSENRSIRFHIIFFVAVLNRETAVFLIPTMFLMQLGRRKVSSLLVNSFLLLIAAFAIRLILYKLLSAGDSSSVSMFDNHFRSNVVFLLTLFKGNTEALRMLMTFGGLWLLLPFCFGKIEPKVMLLTALLPVFFLGMLVVGSMSDEARIFNEMVPVVTVPCILLFSQSAEKSLLCTEIT